MQYFPPNVYNFYQTSEHFYEHGKSWGFLLLRTFCRACWLRLLKQHLLCLDALVYQLVLTRAALLITFLISFQEPLLKLPRVTKACYSFRNKLGENILRLAGHQEKAVGLVCWHLVKVKRSLSYPKSEDNQQMPEIPCAVFILSVLGRNFLGWHLLQRLRIQCMQNDHLQNMCGTYCGALQSSGLPETVCWACCLSCGRVCCSSMSTAHFLFSLHHSNQLGVWLHSHFEHRDIVLYLSAYGIISSSSSETFCMKPGG